MSILPQDVLDALLADPIMADFQEDDLSIDACFYLEVIEKMLRELSERDLIDALATPGNMVEVCSVWYLIAFDELLQPYQGQGSRRGKGKKSAPIVRKLTNQRIALREHFSHLQEVMEDWQDLYPESLAHWLHSCFIDTELLELIWQSKLSIGELLSFEPGAVFRIGIGGE